jgi:hypothetical protein
MKNILIFIAGGLTIWTCLRWGFPGLMSLYFAAIAAYYFWHRLSGQVKKVRTLKEYARTVENVYIYSDDATDPEKNKLIYLRMLKAQKMMEESGNKFSKVIPIYYQDHTAPNETPEEYAARVKSFIEQDRMKHLTKVYKTEGEVFYLRHISKQQGV